jgi:GNAT superfamily N-acetyltransferase
MRATDFIAEIEAIPGWQFSGGKESLQDYNNINTSTLKPLPGSNKFAYAIETAGYFTRILIVDINKNPTDAIAYLEVTKDDLPIKGNPLSVDTITVDEDYRGQGLAKALYSIVLKIMKRPLIAGSSQTPGGRRNWLSLTQIPGVEVKGVVQLSDNQLDTTIAMSNPKHAKNVEKNIDQVMELGGQYLGKDKYASYWMFDVVPGKGQLEPYVKNSLSKIYGYDAPTTLLATWSGK